MTENQSIVSYHCYTPVTPLCIIKEEDTVVSNYNLIFIISFSMLVKSVMIIVSYHIDGSENVTGLDLSDFPALADRNRREGSGNPTPLINPLAGRAPYGN